jgi:beta-phosphoglucomutase-like phosphatase (HAD superfamily)
VIEHGTSHLNLCIALVVEDAPLGIRAGHAAGAHTLAVCTSHSRKVIIDSGANLGYIVDDLTKVFARWVDRKVEVSIHERVN